MMKSRWIVALLALTVFLTACPGPDEPTPARISLGADVTSLPATGGPVALTVTVAEGTVTSVEFFADDVSVGVDSDGGDGFTTTFTAPANTATTEKTITFVATGTTDAGNVNSNEISVTQAAAPSPDESVAPSITINTVAGVPTVSGIAATGLQAVAAEVTGVQGTVSTTPAQAPTKGTVVIQAGTNQLRFTYTPNAGATGTDSFRYTATNGSAAPATGTITLNLARTVRTPNAAGTTLANLDEAGTNEIVVVTGTGIISCAADPCVTMAPGQVILGNGTVTIGDITLTNSNARRNIVANITPSPTLSATTVIALGNDAIVQGIGIRTAAANPGSIYEAIAAGDITGTVTIKDVEIDMGDSVRDAIRIGNDPGTPAPDRNNIVTVSNVTIASVVSGRSGIEINYASSVSITNSVASAVTVQYDAGNTAGTGVSIVGANTTTVLDGVAVVSSASDNDADAGNAPTSSAFLINKTGAGTMSLTVRGTRSTVGGPVAGPPALGAGVGFHLTGNGAGTIAVQNGSSGNTVLPPAAVDFIKTGTVGISGSIGFN
jgi:large repetitive protein